MNYMNFPYVVDQYMRAERLRTGKMPNNMALLAIGINDLQRMYLSTMVRAQRQVGLDFRLFAY